MTTDVHAFITEKLKDEIAEVIVGHLDLYRPIAESITDEIVSLLELRISCSPPV
jgi:hypothetical protein